MNLMNSNLLVKRKKKAISLLAFSILLFGGFCVFSNSIGDYRVYFDVDIPFVYQLNNTTPPEYTGPIAAGGLEWDNVPSSYWEFIRGADTPVGGPGFDNVNLVFFDLEGNNFGPPPSNVIAFSQTFTSNSGGYHSVESDLIWNARDFPPSPNGEPGAQDLQSVMAHEFGHHIGLGHQGPFGGPPGCGVTITDAVMYGFSSNGDTSARHLHIHDIAGVSAMYPSWILEGVVTSQASGQPIPEANIEYIGTNSISIGPVESPTGGVYERPGEVFTTEIAGPTGEYGNITLDQTFDIVIDAFGFMPDTATIAFDPPGGIGVTQTITHDVALQTVPNGTFSGLIQDALTMNPVAARVDFYGTNDPDEVTLSVMTESDGSYSAVIPAMEVYRIVVNPIAPYVDTVMVENIFLPVSGFVLDFDLFEAQVLLVDDDGGSTYEESYLLSLDRVGLRRRTFSVADSGTTPSAVLATFTQRPHLIWFTGTETTNALTSAEGLAIIDHLEAGGEAIITGQNIAEYAAAGDPLLEDYLGIQFGNNESTVLLRGFPDDFIGKGGQYLLVGGAGNQTSKDYLSIVPGGLGTLTRTLYFAGATGDSSKIAGVSVLGPGASWGVTYFSFGLEGFGSALLDTFVVRSRRFFDVLADVPNVNHALLPESYSLEQNYPNPFNPSTRITYALPVESNATLTVYDITGRLVATLFEGEQEAGVHSVFWNGRNDKGNQVASGLYLYKLEASGGAGQVTLTRKMLLLK